jgi:hypothetical protein
MKQRARGWLDQLNGRTFSRTAVQKVEKHMIRNLYCFEVFRKV